MKITIKARFTGSLLFEGEYESTRHAAEAHKANLRGANLYGADLRGADLRGADLYGADLRGADLYGADLYGADLRGADLYGADLYGANLYGADLRGADLYGANLYGADNERIGTIKSILQSGPIGSRKDYVMAIDTDVGIYIHTGCFFGAMQDFENKVGKTHPDGIHAVEYSHTIAMIKAVFAERARHS